MTSTGPILIAYDGSDDARHAIDHAAAILGGADAVVLYVRQPTERLGLRPGQPWCVTDSSYHLAVEDPIDDAAVVVARSLGHVD